MAVLRGSMAIYHGQNNKLVALDWGLIRKCLCGCQVAVERMVRKLSEVIN